MGATDLQHRSLLTTASETAAARWAHRRLLPVAGGIEHEFRVLAIASKLFDLKQSLLHLNPAHARLLRLAALLHDIGRSVSERRHPQDGAELINAATCLPITPAERRQLAFLTRYHRGAIPPGGREDYLAAADDRAALDRILALLRAADGLDNRQLPPLELTFSLAGHHLQIDAAASGDIRRARHVFTRRKKFRLLEYFLGQPIAIDISRSALSTSLVG